MNIAKERQELFWRFVGNSIIALLTVKGIIGLILVGVAIGSLVGINYPPGVVCERKKSLCAWMRLRPVESYLENRVLPNKRNEISV